MSRRWETFLNKWETAAVRGPKRPLPLWFSPDGRLDPREPYSVRLYVRVCLVSGLPVVALMILARLALFIYIWFKYPWFVREAIPIHGRAHADFIALLRHEGYYWAPLALVGFLAFNFLLYLPRYHFWNRRALRLQREGPTEQPDGIADEAQGPTVWPPAPTGHGEHFEAGRKHRNERR